MNLLNTTFCMAEPSAPAFLRWMREIYRPAAEKFGNDIKLLKIPEAESGTATYALQFMVDSHDTASIWLTNHMPGLTALAADKPFNLGKEQLVYFSTVMDIII